MHNVTFKNFPVDSSLLSFPADFYSGQSFTFLEKIQTLNFSGKYISRP